MLQRHFLIIYFASLKVMTSHKFLPKVSTTCATHPKQAQQRVGSLLKLAQIAIILAFKFQLNSVGNSWNNSKDKTQLKR